MTTREASRETRARKNRRRGAGGGATTEPASPPIWPGVPGGAYRPLSEPDLQRINRAALHVLDTIGMSEAPDFVVERIVAKGGRLTEQGRLLFPKALVEDAIAGFRRDIVLFGQESGHELDLSGTRTYMGSGGAAPSVVDLETGLYRDATLRDLYDAARIVDALDNVHFFSRSVIARDMSTPLDLDVNTAYACLAGTRKHVSVSATLGENVQPIADMCFMLAGSSESFRSKPFLSININHVVPPMRFAHDACAVMERAAVLGIPFHVNSLGQSGASSPASLAGSIMQSVVETLAGMVFTWVVNPNCQAVFGPRPLVTDLRTGAMTGGCGEQAVVMAGAAQMAQFYGLPNSCIAGATDSKLPDAQSGYEKALTVSLAAHAGCNMITQAAGMLASLMGCSQEGYVIDNDMLGAILRSVRGIEVDEDTLADEIISDVVHGDGHFLGSQDTLARMQTDYVYPEVADRRSVAEWFEAGAPDVRETARAKTLEILAQHFPKHIPKDADARLREAFDIHLPPETMNRLR